MNAAASHTPTPWKVISGRQNRPTMAWSPSASEGVFNAGYDSATEKEQAKEAANAAFIVRACNAHEALVEAAEAIKAYEEDARWSTNATQEPRQGVPRRDHLGGLGWERIHG